MYIIDSNVIMSDSLFHKNYPECHIPLTVIKELDNHKGDKGEVGKNVREFFRNFDDLSNVHGIIDMNAESLEETNDFKIIAYAANNRFKLVTGDRGMKLIAEVIGVEVILPLKGVVKAVDESEIACTTNVYATEGDQSFIDGELIEPRMVSKIESRNTEQTYAINSLVDPEIELVILEGIAGTGKTLLSIAAALDQTLSTKNYKGITIARPTITMGEGLGYLPGTKEEKLAPFLAPIVDNLRIVAGDDYKVLLEGDLIEAESLAHIRGRSISDRFMIIDEAQNCTPHEIKTILTRAGEGTKIILVGDTNQIDNPKCDSVDNGITYVKTRFKDESIFSYIKLIKGERSRLAELSAQLL